LERAVARSEGRTRAEEARVCFWNRKPERAAELEDIVCILGRGLVAEVTEQLDRSRDTRNRIASYSAEDEALRWIPKCAAPRLRLHAAAVWVEGDGVKVELFVGAPKDKPNRQMVFVEFEAERPKRLLDSRDVTDGDHQIEVFVRSRLPLK